VSDSIYVIAEGDGEVAAAPELIRRLMYEYLNRFEFQVPPARNANGRGNLIRSGGLERFLERLRRASDCRGVIILLDAELEYRDCPPELAIGLAQRSAVLGLPFPVVVVCAVCEYESWFLFNLHTEIKSWLLPDTKYEGADPEQICGAKEWLSNHMANGSIYKETVDQVAMTVHLDILHTMEHSRSFRRMVHATDELVAAIDSSATSISPLPRQNQGN
jgi:hypothetical protein